MTFLSPDASLMLTADASNTVIGASLEQFEDDLWKPVRFFSRKLSGAVIRYSTSDRELLAIHEAIKFFQHIADGRQIVVRTDHRPLIYAFKQKHEKTSERRLRQLDVISQFTTEIVYLKGEDNIVADVLSRVQAINQIEMPRVFSAQIIEEAQREDEFH